MLFLLFFYSHECIAALMSLSQMSILFLVSISSCVPAACCSFYSVAVVPTDSGGTAADIPDKNGAPLLNLAFLHAVTGFNTLASAPTFASVPTAFIPAVVCVPSVAGGHAVILACLLLTSLLLNAALLLLESLLLRDRVFLLLLGSFNS